MIRFGKGFAAALATALILGMANTALATGPGGGIRPLSGAEAEAARGNTIAQDRCMSICQQSARTPAGQAQCPNNCTAGRCYHNPASGRSYCIAR
ncbi:MAG TPA: hypothetical protein PLQ11_10195 [Beijerinckiaceae bacterium]|nr:hypothetical protein [Beijerinckiaceae bacterium]